MTGCGMQYQPPSISDGKTIRFGVNDCNGNAQLTFGGMTYENVILDSYCRIVNITDSLEVAGDLSILGNGTVNMPNPGNGYSINVGGTYSKSANSVLNLNGADLNN